MSGSEQNPYAAPTIPVVPIKVAQDAKYARYPLASRGERLAGAIIDTIVILPIVFVAAMVLVVITITLGFNTETESFDMLLSILSIGLYLLSMLAVNGYLLAKQGQTIGKVVCKTRIVSVRDGSILPLGEMFIRRYVLISLLSAIPFIGSFISLADALAIFRSGKRCLHDEFAATRVVKLHPIADRSTVDTPDFGFLKEHDS
jgi:uncharacterized RDD family membrane protein YckC